MADREAELVEPPEYLTERSGRLLVDDELSGSRAPAEVPVGNGQHAQPRERDRAALVPVAADELGSDRCRQRLDRRVERQRGEWKCEHTQHVRPPWILRLGR